MCDFFDKKKKKNFKYSHIPSHLCRETISEPFVGGSVNTVAISTLFALFVATLAQLGVLDYLFGLGMDIE